MQYIDPYSLFEFDLSSPDELDRSQIRRAKQKILAEFELSEDIVIEFKGHSVDKSTALRLLEELEDPGKKWQHWYLHQNPFLQQFLSQQKVRFLRNIAPAGELGDEAFRTFLSKQLVPIFDRLLTENFKKGRKPEVSLMIQRLDLIHSRDHDLALKGTLRHINLNIQALKEAISGEETNLAFFDGQELYSNSLIDLLNRLPSLYQHVRNRYADALQDLAIALENDWSFTNKAFAVICAAAELETDLSTREHVNHLKVVLWKRQRARRQEEEATPHQSEPQQQEKKQQYEYRWEHEDRFPPEENFFNRKSPKNGATAAWVIIGLVILLIGFFVRGNWKSKPKIEPFKYELPQLPDLGSYDRIYESSNKESEKKIEIFQILNDAEPSEGKKTPRTLETGDQPFLQHFTDKYVKTPSIDRVAIKNNSDQDLVLFVEDLIWKAIHYHRYVKAGEELELDGLEPGYKYFSTYSGTEWNSSYSNYKGEFLGAFDTVHKGPPASYNDEQEGINYVLLYLRNGSSADVYDSGQHYTLEFDGVRLQAEQDH